MMRLAKIQLRAHSLLHCLVSTRNDGCWNSVQSNNLLDIELYQSLKTEGVLDLKEMSRLSQSVDHDLNLIQTCLYPW